MEPNRCSLEIRILAGCCTLSLSFPVLVPTVCLSVSLPLSGVILAIMHKPATRHDKLLPPPPSAPTVLISHSFQSVSQPAHINPSLATSPLLSCHEGPSSLSSFHFSGTFSPSRPARLGEFHPQCGIPHLISRYVGMLGTGQRAVPVIPESAWDYRVHLSKPRPFGCAT